MRVRSERSGRSSVRDQMRLTGAAVGVVGIEVVVSSFTAVTVLTLHMSFTNTTPRHSITLTRVQRAGRVTLTT